MILSGSLIILALAGYWMRRALKAERYAAMCERLLDSSREREKELRGELAGYIVRCLRIAILETPNMAHVGKVAVGIAKGER